MVITNKREQTDLKKSDFYYELPKELIAQHPEEKRDNSRLMVINKETGETEDRIFHDVIDYLMPNDVLVINDSKVIPARLYGVKESTGVDCEIVLLRERGLDQWEALVRPGRRIKVGTSIIFGNGILRATVDETLEGGNRLLSFEYDKKESNFFAILDKIGNMPLPPYITERLEEKERYQTVYAKEEGSAAAPTAGLHFTEELLERIKEKGVKIAPVMLHVGLGTFRPVKEENISDHIMHTEFFSVSKESADIINSAKESGGRIVCVGTTSCRTLESVADEDGHINAMSGDTGIFIYPGYKFKAVDALITNFHLPESTLLMLVSAFAGRDNIMSAYKSAVEKKYRFFSFGDGMLIV